MPNLKVETACDASGAFQAAKRGNLVVVVDVIDMSTTLEAALEAGALSIFGASPDHGRAPVFLNPYYVGFCAGSLAKSRKTGLIVVTEPRVGEEDKRRQNASQAIEGARSAGVDTFLILPNLGAETVKMADFSGQVVLAVTGSGGTAFDAAYNAGGLVTTATVARTTGMKGSRPAMTGARRALELAGENISGISVVAASSHSLEDILASAYIASCIVELMGQLGHMTFTHKTRG